MRLSGPSFIRLILAGALLTLAPAAFGKINSHNVGSYESARSANDKKSVMMDVSLGSDGSATVTQDWGHGPVTSFGKWNEEGSQITVTFSAPNGNPAPAPMVFDTTHGGLQAATWDHAAWGKTTPPHMKKQNGNWHSDDHRKIF